MQYIIYLTPSVIVGVGVGTAMKVPSMQAVEQMHSFVETGHRGKYFVWNLSDSEYSPNRFGSRVWVSLENCMHM